MIIGGMRGVKMATISVDTRRRKGMYKISFTILRHPPTRDPSHDHFASFTEQTDWQTPLPTRIFSTHSYVPRSCVDLIKSPKSRQASCRLIHFQDSQDTTDISLFHTSKGVMSFRQIRYVAYILIIITLKLVDEQFRKLAMSKVNFPIIEIKDSVLLHFFS